MYSKRILVEILSYYKVLTKVAQKEWIIIWVSSIAFRAAILTTKGLEFSFNAALANFYLSINFSCLAISKALAAVYNL